MVRTTNKIFKKAYLKTLKLSKNFKENIEGIVAIEFGMIGLPFFLLIFGTLELSLVFMAEINMSQATADTARKLRTGQSGIETIGQFKADICNKVIFIPNCISKLKVEVKAHNDFSSIDTSFSLNSDGGLEDNFVFDTIDAGGIATVRTFIEWDLFAKIPNLGLGNLPNNNRLVQGFSAFRREP